MFLAFFRKMDRRLLRKQRRSLSRKRISRRRLEVEGLERRDLFAVGTPVAAEALLAAPDSTGMVSTGAPSFSTTLPDASTPQSPAAGTWTALNHLAPSGSGGVMLLLPDGTVMVKSFAGGSDGYGNTWYKLTPDSSGSYANGTWTTLAAMHDTRLYFSSEVLKDGRVFVAGGEYGTGGATAEVYNPLTNTWTYTPNLGQTFSDANSELLPDGRVLEALVNGTLRGTAIYDPVSNTWTAGPSASGIHNESVWVKLPDASILMVDRGSTNSERYIPSLNQWVADATVPVSLYDPFGLEAGPAFLLPDGRAFFIGSPSNTAYYTPSGTTSPGSWAAGPTIPGGQGAPDAAGAMMVNGKILSALSPTPTSGNHFPTPTTFNEYDYTTNTFTQIATPTGGTSLNISSYLTNMLDLPDGTVLYSQQGSSQYYVYSPSGSPLAAGKPTVSSVTLNADGSYHLSGTLLNGISEGAAYGDDWQMVTNYPIVRLTSGGNVYYARTYNWSSTGVMTGSTLETTEFTLPSGIPGGTYSLSVIANGIASDPVTFSVQLQVTSSTPANGAILTTPPTTFTISFNEAVAPASMQPGDLLVDGIAASSVSLNGSNTIATFTYSASPVTTQGLQTMAIAAGAITGADSTTNAAFNASFRYDATTLAVASTNPAIGGIATFSGNSLTYDVTFNEAIDPATAATSNLTLNQGSVTGALVLSGNQTVRYTINGLTTESTLTVTIPAGQLMDAFDNPGFTPFSGSYALDFGTVPYPTPTAGVLPPGSLVYTNSGMSGTVGFTGDTDSFTLAVDPGQTITVLVAPSGGLQAILELRDPTLTLLGTITSTAAGKRAVLQTISTTTAGLYTITVGGAGGTVGSYTLQVTLNAALEAENQDGPSNNTLATAQNIDGSFVSLGGAASRGAVLGQADSALRALPAEIEPNNSIAAANVASANFTSFSGTLYHLGITGSIGSAADSDFYNIGILQPGDFLTISESGAPSSRGSLLDPSVELYRAGSPTRVTFDDDGGPGLDALIYRFAIPVTDTYYVRASKYGSLAGSYSLGIFLEDNAAPPFTGGTVTSETEPNDSIATANDASSSWRPVQYLSSTTAAITRGDTDFYKYQFTAGDLVAVNIHSTSTLNARVNLLNASGTVIASEDGTSNGPANDSPLYGVVIPNTGNYYVQVLPASGTGTYTTNVYLSTTTPPPKASTANDYYAITLAAGDTVTLAIKGLSTGSLTLNLQDGSGTTLATGVAGPANLDQVITDFTVPSAGTYYALVTGTAGTNYNLVVTRNAEFDTESNNSIAAAQAVHSLQFSGDQRLLGAITSGDVDYYKITLAAGTALQAQTATPGDGSGEPVNLLDPLLNLYNASGTLVASDDNSAGDGHNALLNYTVPTGQGGTYYLQVAPVGTTTGDYTLGINQAAGPVVPEGGTGLYVTSFTPMPGGFSASFSEPFVNSSSNPVHLYDAASAGYGAADVALVGQTVGGVSGSLVIDPSNSSFTFVKTGGVLAPDTYTVTFRSGANAFEDLAGGPLNGDGVNPGNYVTTFTVTASSAVVVRVPGFARGPDSSDPINVPNNSANGIPITLSDGAGLTDATFVLQYNADLLAISGGTVNASLPGASLTVALSGSGSAAQATIIFHSATALPAGAVQLGGLSATVPSTAAYQALELLHFSSLALNDGTIAAVGADGIHVAAFLGDTSGDGIYTSQDAVLLLRVAAHADRGFAAFPTTDPVLLADFNGNGSTDAGDGVLLNRYLAGTAVAQMLNYPGLPSNPSVAPSSSLVLPGAVVSVPATTDGAVQTASTGLAPVVSAPSFDLAALTVSAANLPAGSVTVWTTAWGLPNQVDAGAGPPSIPGDRALSMPDRASLGLEVAVGSPGPDAIPTAGQPARDEWADLCLAALDAYFAEAAG